MAAIVTGKRAQTTRFLDIKSSNCLVDLLDPAVM